MKEQPQSQCKKNDKQDHKLRWDLLPLTDLEEVVKVSTAGAEKYGENTWQNLPDGYNRYKAAMFRHLVHYEKGELIDEETGCLHIAQVAWNAIAMLHCALKDSKKVVFKELELEGPVMERGQTLEQETLDAFRGTDKITGIGSATPYKVNEWNDYTITTCESASILTGKFIRVADTFCRKECPFFESHDPGNHIIFCKRPKTDDR